MSQEQQIQDMYRANYPTAYVTEGQIIEIVKRLKEANLKATAEDISRALFDYQGRNPEHPPSASQLISEVRRVKSKGGGSHLTVIPASKSKTADNFIQALRDEPDLDKRWSLICHADQDLLYNGEREDGTTIWKRNHARLYCQPSDDPCQRAQRLADRHDIEYRQFTPPKDEQGEYLNLTQLTNNHQGVKSGAGERFRSEPLSGVPPPVKVAQNAPDEAIDAWLGEEIDPMEAF
jgi:hypothetical protein